MRRLVRQNASDRPHGFPWPHGQRVYHATLALDRVREEGLKPRRDLGDEIHATGGGPSESISFSLDRRVCVAIALGLRTLAHAARRELQLGQMIIDLQRVAPKGTATQLNDMKLTPEKVVLLDAGLVPFSVGPGSWQHTVSMDAYEAAPRRDLHEVKEEFAGGSRPYAVSGWAAPRVVQRMQEESKRKPGTSYEVTQGLEQYDVNRMFEFYKYMLSYSEWEKELYNPLFMHTDPAVMAGIADEQIGVVEATLGADWICAEASAANALGYDTSKFSAVWLSDWAHSCEQRLRHGWKSRDWLPKEWDEPEAADTVAYAASMAEVRVYEPAMIQDLRVSDYIEDALSDASLEWSNRGVEWEEPLAYPHFKARHPQLAR